MSVLPSGDFQISYAAVFLRDGSDCMARTHDSMFSSEDTFLVFCRHSPKEPVGLAWEYRNTKTKKPVALPEAHTHTHPKLKERL